MKSLIGLSLIFCSVLAFAADPKNTTGGHAPEWMKFTVPGEGHKALNDLAGKFKYTMKWWESADDNTPEESKGTSTSQWLLKNRFLQQKVKGKAMGQAFNGVGVTGYDNLREEYQSVWMDDMSTSMMWSTGKRDPAANTIEQTGTASDPMKGEKNAWYRTQLKVVSKNEHIYEMFSKGQDGKEYKSMEIHYTRSK